MCILPQLPNGYFLFRNHWPIRDEQLTHGKFIEAFCDSHHQMHGEKLIGCYYGKWIPKIPTCEKSKYENDFQSAFKLIIWPSLNVWENSWEMNEKIFFKN